MTQNSDGKGYAGRGGLNDGSDEFNSISSIVEQAIARVSTMKLVKVVAVKSKGEVAGVGFVDVQPLVKQQDGLGNTESHGQIFDVPYFRLGGGKSSVIIDPVVGDIGLMVVADRDISAVKSEKKESTPGSFRRHDAADGVYLGSLLSDTPEQYVRFSPDDGVSILTKDGAKFDSKDGYWSVTNKGGNSIVGSAAGWLFKGICTFENNVQLGGTIKAQNGATYAGNIITSGQVQAAGISLAAHTHSGVQPGGSNTGGPT